MQTIPKLAYKQKYSTIILLYYIMLSVPYCSCMFIAHCSCKQAHTVAASLYTVLARAFEHSGYSKEETGYLGR